MCLQIGSREINGVTILDLTGKIVVGEQSVRLRSTIRNNVARGNIQLLLNMSQVNDIDATGIGELVSSFITVNKEGGAMRLSNMKDTLLTYLAITKLNTLFDFFEDEDTALRSFRQNV